MPTATAGLDALRSTIHGALRDFSIIGDDVLERPWEWADHGAIELRYGFFVALEDLETSGAEIEGSGDGRRHARRIVAPAAVAAWDLLGLLATLTEDDLDAEPGGREWTIRRAVAHTLASQRSYAIYTDWWRQQGIPGGARPLPEPPDDLDGPQPEETYADGSLDTVRALIHATLDDAAARTAHIADEELALAGRWYGKSLTIGFRQGRWSPHIAEHTVQIENTLVMLGRQPTEVDRLVRRVATAWGRIERTLWPSPANDTAARLAAAVAARTAGTAASVRATAERG